MIKPLSDETIEKIYFECGVFNPPSNHYLNERVAQEALRYTLEQMVEWGDERCPHPSTFDGQLLTRKKNCPECWQELKKLAEEGR